MKFLVYKQLDLEPICVLGKHCVSAVSEKKTHCNETYILE